MRTKNIVKYRMLEDKLNQINFYIFYIFFLYIFFKHVFLNYIFFFSDKTCRRHQQLELI